MIGDLEAVMKDLEGNRKAIPLNVESIQEQRERIAIAIQQQTYTELLLLSRRTALALESIADMLLRFEERQP